MHKSTLVFSVAVMILFFLLGCGKEEDLGVGGNENGNGSKAIILEVSTSPIHFAAEGGSKEIMVSTNANFI